jgi:hypothetical protein
MARPRLTSVVRSGLGTLAAAAPPEVRSNPDVQRAMEWVTGIQLAMKAPKTRQRRREARRR